MKNKTENKAEKRKRYYEKAFAQMLCEGMLTGVLLDPCSVLRDKKHSPGVYRWYVYDLKNNTRCLAYAGETTDVYERTLEHLKHWLYRSQTFHYLGIYPNELATRYILILEVEIDPAGIAFSSKDRRKAAELSVIRTEEPYTQYTLDPLQKIDPSQLDSCIWHKYRRDAFLRAINA